MTASHAYSQPRVCTVDGLAIRFAESADPGRDAHALLLSPRPQSVHAFALTWSRLAEHAHLVAIDVPLFGHSGHTDALMTPRAPGEFIARAADAFGLEPAPVPRSSLRPSTRGECAASSSGVAVRRPRCSSAVC